MIISDIETKNEKEVGSDHTPVTFKIKLKEEIEKLNINSTIKQYHKVTWNTTNDLMIQKFQQKPKTKKEIDEHIKKLENTIKMINRLIPTVEINRTNHGINKQTRKDIQEKRKLIKEHKRTKDPRTKNKINQLNKKIQKSIKNSETKILNKKIDLANSKNSKDIFSSELGFAE